MKNYIVHYTLCVGPTEYPRTLKVKAKNEAGAQKIIMETPADIDGLTELKIQKVEEL